MDHQINEDLPRDEPRLNRSTGPSSPEGKARSSMNRLTHGCRSEKTVLPDEDPAEFESNMEGWIEQYLPDEGIGALLVQETGLAHWFLKRARRRLEEVEWELPSNPNSWTEPNEKRFEKFTRYKTTAERAFSRNFRELEAHFDRIVRDDNTMRLAQVKLAAIEMKWLSKKEENAFETLKIKQYVEVKAVDGQYKTDWYPTNEELIEEVAKRPQPPLYITRFIHFADGVPAEYDWSKPNELQKHSKTTGLQKMTYTRWLRAIDDEKQSGHIGPLDNKFN
jgi:hypothetical protein